MKKTLLIVSAIALSVSVFASGTPDKAAACSKDAVVKAACCATDGAACDAKKAACKLDQTACDAKKAACNVKAEAEKVACDVQAEAEKAACEVKEAAEKKVSCGGCPLSK